MKFDTKILMIFNKFRELEPEMSIHQAACFMLIAKFEGLSMKELGDKLGIAQSSTSRNVAALSKWHRLNREGLDLVEAKEDPAERRRKIVMLTPKGRALIEALKMIFEKEET